jgi:hypothetical protein
MSEANEVSPSDQRERVERLVMCDECRDTGEKVIFNDRFAEGYAIVFCGCIDGRVLAATQADVLNEHGA